MGGEFDESSEAGTVWPRINKRGVKGSGINGGAISAVILDDVDRFISGDDKVVGVGEPLNIGNIDGGILSSKAMKSLRDRFANQGDEWGSAAF